MRTSVRLERERGDEMNKNLKMPWSMDDIIGHCERRVVALEDIFGKEKIAQMPIQDGVISKEYWEYKQVAAYLRELKQLREESKWIPVVMRESTNEEREELKVEMMCDFPLPGDEQEILISSNGRVFIDTCCWDGYDTWLGGSGAWTDVDAWRPLPKAYEGEE